MWCPPLYLLLLLLGGGTKQHINDLLVQMACCSAFLLTCAFLMTSPCFKVGIFLCCCRNRGGHDLQWKVYEPRSKRETLPPVHKANADENERAAVGGNSDVHINPTFVNPNFQSNGNGGEKKAEKNPHGKKGKKGKRGKKGKKGKKGKQETQAKNETAVQKEQSNIDDVAGIAGLTHHTSTTSDDDADHGNGNNAYSSSSEMESGRDRAPSSGVAVATVAGQDEQIQSQVSQAIHATEDRKANILTTANQMQFLIPMEGGALSVAPPINQPTGATVDAAAAPAAADDDHEDENDGGTVQRALYQNTVDSGSTITYAIPADLLDSSRNDDYDMPDASVAPDPSLSKDALPKKEWNKDDANDGDHAITNLFGGALWEPVRSKTGTLELPMYGNLGVGSPRSPEESPDYTNMDDVKHKTIWTQQDNSRRNSSSCTPRKERTMSVTSLARFEDVFGEAFGGNDGGNDGLAAYPAANEDCDGGRGDNEAVNYAVPTEAAEVYASPDTGDDGSNGSDGDASLPYSIPAGHVMEYIPQDVNDDLGSSSSSDNSDYEVIEERAPSNMQSSRTLPGNNTGGNGGGGGDVSAKTTNGAAAMLGPATFDMATRALPPTPRAGDAENDTHEC